MIFKLSFESIVVCPYDSIIFFECLVEYYSTLGIRVIKESQLSELDTKNNKIMLIFLYEIMFFKKIDILMIYLFIPYNSRRFIINTDGNLLYSHIININNLKISNIRRDGYIVLWKRYYVIIDSYHDLINNNFIKQCQKIIFNEIKKGILIKLFLIIISYQYKVIYFTLKIKRSGYRKYLLTKYFVPKI